MFSLFTAVFDYTKALFNQPLFYPLPPITLMDLLQNNTSASDHSRSKVQRKSCPIAHIYRIYLLGKWISSITLPDRQVAFFLFVDEVNPLRKAFRLVHRGSTLPERPARKSVFFAP